MTTFVPGITPKRAVALYHLNVNPDRLTRIEGSLEDYAHNVCAAGLACHALGIKMKTTAGYSDPDPESALADMLEMPYSHVRGIFRLNDSYHLSFNQVGGVLTDYFNQEVPAGSAVRSPESIYLADINKYKEVEGGF
jgi:hypothetical protein